MENRPFVKFIRNYFRDFRRGNFLVFASEDIRDFISRSNCMLFEHSLPNAKRKWRAIRFVKLSEADIISFSEAQENVFTQKKALYDSKLCKEFLTSEDERREL